MVIDPVFETATRHHQAGRLREAETLYRQILAVQPDHADALHRLGLVQLQKGDIDGGVQLIKRAVSLNPGRADFYGDLGSALVTSGHYQPAIAALRRAIALAPDYFQAWYSLGWALTMNNQAQEAVGVSRQALKLRPDSGDACFVLAMALESNRQVDEALHTYRRAIALNPDLVGAHVRCGMLLLKTGQWAEGWQEYEWDHGIHDQRSFAQPQWDGSPAPGKVLLIYPSRRLGDTMTYVRFLPLVRDRGVELMIECPPPLLALFRASFPDLSFLPQGERLPHFDLRLRFESLPRVLGITQENLPTSASMPYLRVPPDRLGKWSGRVPQDGTFHVGLVWAGSNSIFRSSSLGIFAPLAAVAGVRFFSLQKGPESSQVPPAGLQLVDYTAELDDFADTAALVQQLDLVLCVDTSVVHLAGAIGKPVWVLVPQLSDRDYPLWPLDRSDSPWYPKIRLFRQRQPGDWDIPVQEMTEALKKFLLGALPWVNKNG